LTRFHVRAALAGLATTVVLLAFVSHASAVTVVRGYAQDWRPRRVEIGRGTTVKWRSIVDDHNVTAYRGRWRFARVVREGDAIRYTFDRRGRYRYVCTWHGSVDGEGHCTGMCGVVRVG
jgi:plastocyanin